MSKVARPKTDTAPDVRLGQLWPYFREHQLALSVVAVLSLVTAGTSLAQRLLVSRPPLRQARNSVPSDDRTRKRVFGCPLTAP